VNHNNYDFGFENQDVPFGDVVLPPWADTPEDFVRIMREALGGFPTLSSFTPSSLLTSSLLQNLTMSQTTFTNGLT
jgi:hypothetical protein